MTFPVLHIARVEAPNPIGPIFIVSDGSGMIALDFVPTVQDMMPQLKARFGPNQRIVEADDPQGFASAVQAYLAGDMTTFESIPTDGGGTPFQRRVWSALRKIPAGQTWSYGQLARFIGHPKAFRAVGLANGRNPVNLVVPCHRVIGSTGALTGYGRGIERKKWLLEFESGAMARGNIPRDSQYGTL